MGKLSGSRGDFGSSNGKYYHGWLYIWGDNQDVEGGIVEQGR
jgi:hypothetical protein